MSFCFDSFDTPIGPLTVVADYHGVLMQVAFRSATQMQTLVYKHDPAMLEKPRQQLLNYFNGQRQAFDLLWAAAGTEFQLNVWNALQTIPFGETWSYQQLAQYIGRPTAVRAVAHAVGRNPLPIVLPCHRVIAKNGSLCGFSGGLPRKAALLRLEGITIAC